MFRIIFFILNVIIAEIFEQCTLPSYDGLVLTKYYRDTCPHCQRITPLIKEIDERLERHDISLKVRNVECSKCNCGQDKIDAVPTIVLTRDGEKLGEFKGFREYDYIVNFINKYAGIDKKYMEIRIKNVPGKVIKLKEKDFYSGFEGPWLILFYKDKNDPRREMLKEVGDIFKEKLNVGEISSSESKDIAFRYQITEYPVFKALYNGIETEYYGKNMLPSLVDFVDELLAPTFDEITNERFDKIKDNTKKGDPIFVVFYSDLYLANSYFKTPAHEFKFKIKIYKTNDNNLFEKAGIHPKQKNGDKNVRDNDAVVLTVYRNGIFHRSDIDLSKTEEIYDWLFHAHYPHVTKLSDMNFQSLFFGIKPIVLFVTHGENLVDKFESLSLERHLGLPFAQHIYVVVDLINYGSFAKVFFGGHKQPSILIYDPIKKKFYSENIILKDNDFIEKAHKIIRKFDEGKLREYKSNIGTIFRIVIIVLCIILGLSFGMGYIKNHMNKYAKYD